MTYPAPKQNACLHGVRDGIDCPTCKTENRLRAEEFMRACKTIDALRTENAELRELCAQAAQVANTKAHREQWAAWLKRYRRALKGMR